MMSMSGAERKNKKVSAVFVTSTVLSPVAKQAAEWLEIEVKEKLAMNKGYPIIKCNVNQATKEKIYHLPFDQQYDRTQINASMNEFYATTCAEAENMGFRRAMKYFGT
jgi:D-arabinose 5-phosphate isomerase GutQ